MNPARDHWKVTLVNGSSSGILELDAFEIAVNEELLKQEHL